MKKIEICYELNIDELVSLISVMTADFTYTAYTNMQKRYNDFFAYLTSILNNMVIDNVNHKDTVLIKISTQFEHLLSIQ